MKEPPYHIALIGNGNVSFHLARWFQQSGCQLTSIFSRTPAENDLYRNSLNYKGENCDFIIVAVNDDAIESILEQINNIGDAIVLHTSGRMPISVLENKGIQHFGVLYPLQTLQKDHAIPIEKVPFLLEASDESTLESIIDLCHLTGMHCQHMSSDNRMMYHLAAVFSSNFTNHLLHIANSILLKEGNSIDLLRPLIEETVRKAFEVGAKASQTGPAKRKDFETMRKHLDLLDSDRHKEIYELISQSIISEQQRLSE